MRTFAIPFGKYAEIAQLVEHNLAKVRVASSSLVFRSKRVSRNADLNFANHPTGFNHMSVVLVHKAAFFTSDRIQINYAQTTYPYPPDSHTTRIRPEHSQNRGVPLPHLHLKTDYGTHTLRC